MPSNPPSQIGVELMEKPLSCSISFVIPNSVRPIKESKPRWRMCSKPKGNGSTQSKRNRWAGEGQLGATEASPSRARKSHLDLTKSKGARRKEPKRSKR